MYLIVENFLKLLKAARGIVIFTVFVFSVNCHAEPKLYFVQSDQLEAPHELTDENQTVVWKADYKPFGEVVPQEDPDGNGAVVRFNLRFPGQYYDAETGLYYNYYRYYDPTLGRYVQSDPIGLAGGMNTYGYVYQNPLNFNDPLGLLALEEAAGSSGAALGAALGLGGGNTSSTNQSNILGSITCPYCSNVSGSNTQNSEFWDWYDKKHPSDGSDGEDTDQKKQCPPPSRHDCYAKYLIDISTCKAVNRLRGTEAGAKCYSSASERYSACLANRPLPPLNVWNN